MEEKSERRDDIIAECTIGNRIFAITVNKQIYEKKNGTYIKCTEDSKETAFLKKYTKPPKSLDVER